MDFGFPQLVSGDQFLDFFGWCFPELVIYRDSCSFWYLLFDNIWADAEVFVSHRSILGAFVKFLFPIHIPIFTKLVISSLSLNLLPLLNYYQIWLKISWRIYNTHRYLYICTNTPWQSDKDCMSPFTHEIEDQIWDWSHEGMKIHQTMHNRRY